MEKKIKWLLSCLAFGVLVIYINQQSNNIIQYDKGIYHEECSCHRYIQEYPIELLNSTASLTCSTVRIKLIKSTAQNRNKFEISDKFIYTSGVLTKKYSNKGDSSIYETTIEFTKKFIRT